VCHQSGDLQRYQTPSFRRLFAEQLPAAMRRLLVDPTPIAQAEALSFSPGACGGRAGERTAISRQLLDDANL